MRIVTANEWQQWLANGRVIEQDARGPKVIACADGQLLKVFRPRRRLWLARWFSHAQRFTTHAQQLSARGLCVPQVTECLWIERHHAVSACRYVPLPGYSMEQLFQQSPDDFLALLPEFAAFIRELHQKGVYFRSLHLGNVLRLPDGHFGLIDFLDVRFRSNPLSLRLVRRNFQHLHGYLVRNKIEHFPWEALQAHYARAGSA